MRLSHQLCTHCSNNRPATSINSGKFDLHCSFANWEWDKKYEAWFFGKGHFVMNI